MQNNQEVRPLLKHPRCDAVPHPSLAPEDVIEIQLDCFQKVSDEYTYHEPSSAQWRWRTNLLVLE
jgi:hypothetical protein